MEKSYVAAPHADSVYQKAKTKEKERLQVHLVML